MEASSSTVSANVNQKPNEPCQCGSGKKFKKCCRLQVQVATARVATAKAGAAPKAGAQQVTAAGSKPAKSTGHMGGHKNVGGHTGGGTAMR